jgi:hypothetical protein
MTRFRQAIEVIVMRVAERLTDSKGSGPDETLISIQNGTLLVPHMRADNT